MQLLNALLLASLAVFATASPATSPSANAAKNGLVASGHAKPAAPAKDAIAKSATVASATPIDPGSSSWVTFDFGGAGASADGDFSFTSTVPLAITVTDLYCAGDSFQVFDSGVSIGVTPPVPSDGCQTYVGTPDAALASSAFSHATFNLAPGAHDLTFVAVNSPFGGGAGAFKLVAPTNVCGYTLSTGKIIDIFTTKVPFSSAAGVCSAKGLKLADVSSNVFTQNIQDEFSCLGPYSVAWVASWNGVTYPGSCLAMYTGATPAGGTIVADVCTNNYAVVCSN